MGTVFLQLCLQFSLIMLLLTVVALLASGCLGEVVLPQGHVMAGRMPYNNPFFHYNGFNNGMINHHLLRSSHHVVDPGFGMVNTMPFRAGFPMTYGTGIVNNMPFRTNHMAPTMAHSIAPTMTHSMLHPFHAGQPMVRTVAPNTHIGSIIPHSSIHGVNTGIHGITSGLHGFNTPFLG